MILIHRQEEWSGVCRLAMRLVCPDSCHPIDCVKEGITRSRQDLLEDARLVVERKGELDLVSKDGRRRKTRR